MFPLARAPFWYRFFDSQPFGYMFLQLGPPQSCGHEFPPQCAPLQVPDKITRMLGASKPHVLDASQPSGYLGFYLLRVYC